MTTYPIRVEPLELYTGNEPRFLRKFQTDMRRAQSISRYINGQIESDFKGRSSAVVTFGDIATALHLDEQIVQSYLHRYAGASDSAIEIQIPEPNGS